MTSAATPSPVGVDPAAFRFALGRFATGVAVVTAQTEGGVAGITINSFTSVSLKPPIVLWCLDDKASRYPLFATATQFGVSILAADRFAKSPAPFADESDWEFSAAGAPVMKGALAQLSCRTVDARPLGDHLVIAGEVESLAARDGAPLAYFGGRYAGVQTG
jgi:flavin reductase (DIM6/NTAB) family NADH-FMN oxidoreductase RutF